MSKLFKTWSVDQLMLLSPSVQELVPAGHLAPFVRDTVRDSLDLSAVLKTYTEERGFPPYHPIMMTALLLYAYCQGIYASRRIAKACEERVDFMAVTALSGVTLLHRRGPTPRQTFSKRNGHSIPSSSLFVS